MNLGAVRAQTTASVLPEPYLPLAASAWEPTAVRVYVHKGAKAACDCINRAWGCHVLGLVHWRINGREEIEGGSGSEKRDRKIQRKNKYKI
jgi:hypothetical protein